MMRAIHFSDRRAFQAQKIAGSTYFDLTQGEPGEVALWFFCPCGCQELAMIIVGIRHQPAGIPSWKWTGSMSDPTLTPSVNRIDCGWHGWLRDGYWEPIA